MPRRRLWRIVFWVALIAILAEVLSLTSTFIEFRKRRLGESAGLVPDQIAAVVRLWPSLSAAQRKDLLTATSSAGLSFHLVSEAPVMAGGSPAEMVHVREIETAMRSRLGYPAGSDAVVALIRARGSGNDGRRVNWALSNETVRLYVRLMPGAWLLADVRGDLLPRFLGLPTGFWVGVVGLLLAGGVLIAILREGRAVERIAGSVEAFAATGVPAPIAIGGSPEVAGLARRVQRMQEQVATLLAERNAMLGAVAHDIKTYVQRLKLRLEVLDLPDQVQKAGRDLDSMDRLVEDALLVALHANPLSSRETIDLFGLIAHEVEAARLLGGDVTLHHAGSGPLLVSGDHAGLSRAFSNVIGNALRYGKRARVSLRRSRGIATVIVDDDGPGIAQAERERVFRAFHRAESSRSRSTGGTGLGLAIAHGIIERQHGGSIEIGDAPGGGARISMQLPLAV